ncbi:hypothetical protein [Streptomyces sp. NPDC008125]
MQVTGDAVATPTVRGLDDAIHARLRARAARHR